MRQILYPASRAQATVSAVDVEQPPSHMEGLVGQLSDAMA